MVIPLPCGRSGWVTTSGTLYPAEASLSSEATANCGVPQKTRFTALLPVAGAHELPDLAPDQVALQRADVADEQLAVQMVVLMQKGAGQQTVAGVLEPIARHALGAHRDHVGPGDIFPEVGQAQAALAAALAAFLFDDLGVDGHQFLRGV